MTDRTVSLPAEQYEQLQALATARGVSTETQLARIVEDACAAADADGTETDLPLGVCDGSGRE